MSCIVRCCEEFARNTAITQRRVIVRFVGALMHTYVKPLRGGAVVEALLGGAECACESVQRCVALHTSAWTKGGCDIIVPYLTRQGVECAF